VEMHSTGEVACFGRDVYEAFLLSLMGAGFKLPTPQLQGGNTASRKGQQKEKAVLISIGSTQDKARFLDSATTLTHLGYRLMATPGTAEFLSTHGVTVETVSKPNAKESAANADTTIVKKTTENAGSEKLGSRSVLDALTSDDVSMVINITNGANRSEITDGYLIRRTAVDYGISLITNLKGAILLAASLKKHTKVDGGKWTISSILDLYRSSALETI